MIYNTTSSRVHAESDRFALCLEIDADYFQYINDNPGRSKANEWAFTMTDASQRIHKAIMAGFRQLGRQVDVEYAGVFVNGKPAHRYSVLTRQNHTCIQSIIDDIVEVL